MKGDFTFMVFAGEPFQALGVEKIDLPIPVSVAAAASKAAASAQEVPLDLSTLRDFVMVCCKEHPELVGRCLPAKWCLAFLFGKQALSEGARMLNSGRDFNDEQFIADYSVRLEHAADELTLACELTNRWTDAPLHLKQNCHWYMGRLHMLAQDEDKAIAEFENVIAICGSTELVPDVWFALAGIFFSKLQSARATALLVDYVNRAIRLFPNRISEFLQMGRVGAIARRYPQVQEFFERLEK